jgi:MFS family permease
MKSEKISGYHMLLFAVCFISTAIGGTVSTLMSVYLPVAVRELFNTQNGNLDRVSSYINALFIVGWTLGGFASGILSDYFGRKKSLLLSIGLYGVFTILTGQMINWQGVMICRFITGIGVGAVLVTSVTMLSEVWPEKSRAIFIGILSIAFPVGIFSRIDQLPVYIMAPGIYGGIIPLIISSLGIVLIRESERRKNMMKEKNHQIHLPSYFPANTK